MRPEVQFHPETGVWESLSVGGRRLTLKGTEDITVQSSPHPFPSRDAWRLVSLQRRSESVQVVRQAGDWELHQTFAVRDWRLQRDALLRWKGSEPVRLQGVVFRTPVLRLSEDSGDFALLPGEFPIQPLRLGELKAGQVRQEAGWTRGEYGIALVHSPARRLSVVAGYLFQMDQARVSVEGAEGGFILRHDFDTLLHLRPGQELSLGTQVIEIVLGDERELREALARFSDTLGNGPPTDVPAHLRGGCLYELHPWGRIESWGAGDRGNRFPRITAQLPFLRELGVTTLWLLPVSAPPPWVYTLPEFNYVARESGTPEELRELVQRAHELGMKVAIDLVVYGVHPDSKEVERLPDEVWCVDEDGNRVKVWGGTVLAADVSHPAWQRRIHEVVTRWAREYGFDGARLDVMGWGQAPHWRHPLRANASIAYGGLRLNQVVRDAFRAVTRDGFILPEAGKPLAFRHADLLFDYPWYMVMRDVTLQPDLARWIREAREWLEWERCCYPPRARHGLVRFLENHDTVPAAQFFGVGLSQALMAVCCFLQGVPLVYQEQETGFSHDLSRWLHLRQRERCLADGEADYLAVQCSHPHVFAFLRQSQHGAAVVAVNLTGEKVRCRLSWQDVLSRQFPNCVEAFSGQEIPRARGAAEVEIPPYRPVVLLLRPSGAKGTTVSPPVPRGTTMPEPRWQVLPNGAVRARGAERWFVETPEGNLEDRFRDYHVRVKPGEQLVDALPVLKRAWNPLEEGLLDGVETASLGVRWADGSELRLRVDTSIASDVRLVDERLDGGQVDLIVQPRQAYQVGEGRRSAPSREGVEVTPLFVQLQRGRSILYLGRRHGGLPIAWSREGREIQWQEGDLYTDWGLVEGGYASADGETNPRLKVWREGRVQFTGWLRHRAWNGVQSCPLASPGTRYLLEYALEEPGVLRVSMGVRPQVERREGRAFFALRLPLRGFLRWQRGEVGGHAGERTGVRLGEGDLFPLTVWTEIGVLRVVRARDVQNLFLIDTGGGEAVLFLALLDGKPIPLRPGAEWTGEVWLSWGG